MRGESKRVGKVAGSNPFPLKHCDLTVKRKEGQLDMGGGDMRKERQDTGDGNIKT